MTTEQPITHALFRYRKSNGTFDYEQYVRQQVAANERKLVYTWVQPRTIDTLCRYLARRIPAPQFGLCHGVRRGMEQQLCKRYFPTCVVLGTEIAPTATQFPDTVQWDFHEVNPEWQAKADFVYSNSLDHAYDPQKAMGVWVQQLKPRGLCFIEWWASPTGVVEATSVDCFRATVPGCRELIDNWGAQAEVPYAVVDSLSRIRSPRRGHQRGRDGALFVVARKR